MSTQNPHAHDAQERLGKQLAAALDDGLDQLPDATLERLQRARQAALATVHETAWAKAPAWASASGPTAPTRGRGLWALLGPALLLGAGLLAIAQTQWVQQALGLGSMDASVLKDSLPPNAYGDPGFNEYLEEKTETETPPPDEEEARR